MKFLAAHKAWLITLAAGAVGFTVWGIATALAKSPRQ